MTDPALPVQRQGQDLLLKLYIQPGARKNAIVGQHGHSIKIRLTSAPVDDGANQQLLRLLAELFAVNTRQVELIKGQHSRHKQVRIIRPRFIPAAFDL